MRGRKQAEPPRCADCGTPHYLPSLSDPRCCYHCAVLRAAVPDAQWIACVFGKVRKVPPKIAMRWYEVRDA